MTEELVDQCLREALLLKSNSLHGEASLKYEEAALMMLEMGNSYMAADAMERSGDMLRRVEGTNASTPYEKAVPLFMEYERYSRVGTLSVKLAEIARIEGMMSQAGKLYTQASCYYDMDGAHSFSAEQLLRAGECYFSAGDYGSTLECYRRALIYYKTLSPSMVSDLEKTIESCEDLALHALY
jgi:tetratricopeptide (TPR) repeat protein